MSRSGTSLSWTGSSATSPVVLTEIILGALGSYALLALLAWRYQDRIAFPALLWFYGNGETIAAIWPVLREFRPPRTALLVVDYPGYGASGGRTTEAALYEAADLAYAALATRTGVDPSRVRVYGRSLGSVAATYVAAAHPVAGLILESPFTNARDMARRHYAPFPPFLIRLRLDNLRAITRE